MRLFFPCEGDPSERRAALVPDVARRFVELGAEVVIEAGLGARLNAPDDEYVKAGAVTAADRGSAFGEADMVLRLRPPGVGDVAGLRRGCMHVSFLEPFTSPDLVRALAEAHVSAMAMDLVPRTTVAQKMDALSSQASLAGYEAVVIAAERLAKIFPMMMTPAGTLQPARVFVIGAGVAGLQAIATAKRLGARVEAFDSRPAAAEQVESLGARFVRLDLGETGQTEQGYAKALTDEQLAKQRDLMARHCAQADVVITTAQVFGRRAPVLVTAEMLGGMRPGSVVVDLAVDTGGNVEGVTRDEETDVGGVRVIGLCNLAGRSAVDASLMYASNLYALIAHFWDADARAFRLDPEDELMRGLLVTHEGRICHETVRKHLEPGAAP